MDKREEMRPSDIPEWAIEEARKINLVLPYAHVQEQIAHALSQAHSKAYEECAKIVDKRAKKAANVSAGACMAMMLALPDAIRQHSQKGGEK